MDLVILNLCLVKRNTPEPAPLSPSYHTNKRTPVHLPASATLYKGSSVSPELESTTLWLPVRDHNHWATTATYYLYKVEYSEARSESVQRSGHGRFSIHFNVGILQH
ncbi:hypothetical protein TNCV_1075931 [Trichonephila clavipes]|uniref:Uncharacterized protein n=1 Tax=Trichonephila clavipes TaxID=2585209 RepID=A0A8X6VQJ0_TRICX|nr:hypothetical protein TNCV_1075931 [Trichonephila clavipes]